MNPITPQEQEAMEWASSTIKHMYYNLSETFRRMHHHEEIPHDSVYISTSLLPFSLNGKLTYYLLKYFGGSVLGKNGSMFSLVTNSNGDRIIWALLEPRIDGVYPELHELTHRLEEPWALKAGRLITENRYRELFHHLRGWIATEEELCHVDLGIVKVGNIQFFMELKDAYDRIEDPRRIHLLLPAVERAFYRIFHEHWLRFYPKIPAVYIMRILEKVFALFEPWNRMMLRLFTPQHVAGSHGAHTGPDSTHS
jgi:hypothetical protein